MSNVNATNKADAKIELTEEEVMEIFLQSDDILTSIDELVPIDELVSIDDPYISDLRQIADEREKGKLEKDLPAIVKENYHSYSFANKQNIAKEYFDLGGVSNDQISALERMIGKLLEFETKTYETSLILELRNLKKTVTCALDYQLKKRDFIMQELNVDFVYDDDDCLQENLNDLRSFYRSASYDIRRLIDDVPLNKDNSFKDIHDIYKRSLNPAIDEKKIDQQLHDAIINLSDRIYEMRQAGTSFGKIQKTLTQECIDSGTIPKKIYRKSRAQGASNEAVEYDTLLPISGIKSVIKLKDSEKAATQH